MPLSEDAAANPGPSLAQSSMVTPWWERRVPCRADRASEGCYEQVFSTLDCRTEMCPHTGVPVKRCVKLHQRLLKCPGRPVITDMQQQELTARGEEAEKLQPNLDLVPHSLSGGGSSSSSEGQQPVGEAAATPAPAVQTEDVGQAMEDFLRFAEQLHERLLPQASVPGIELDEPPGAVAQQGGPRPDALPLQPAGLLQWLLSWPHRKAGSGASRVDEKVWQDFAREFTEV